jgi:hypothetical protein
MDASQKALVTALCVLCESEALATLRFRRLHQNFQNQVTLMTSPLAGYSDTLANKDNSFQNHIR